MPSSAFSGVRSSWLILAMNDGLRLRAGQRRVARVLRRPASRRRAVSIRSAFSSRRKRHSSISRADAVAIGVEHAGEQHDQHRRHHRIDAALRSSSRNTSGASANSGMREIGGAIGRARDELRRRHAEEGERQIGLRRKGVRARTRTRRRRPRSRPRSPRRRCSAGPRTADRCFRPRLLVGGGQLLRRDHDRDLQQQRHQRQPARVARRRTASPGCTARRKAARDSGGRACKGCRCAPRRPRAVCSSGLACAADIDAYPSPKPSFAALSKRLRLSFSNAFRRPIPRDRELSKPARAWPFEEARKVVARVGTPRQAGQAGQRSVVRDRLRPVGPAAYRHVRRGRAHDLGAPRVRTDVADQDAADRDLRRHGRPAQGARTMCPTRRCWRPISASR